MQNFNDKREEPVKKLFNHSKGITCFDKKIERNFFFGLTIIMLVWGIIVKFGLFTG